MPGRLSFLCLLAGWSALVRRPTLHAGGRAPLHRATLADVADGLDPARFVRVHRSAVVNVDRIVRLDTLSHGAFEAVLRDGSRCPA